MTQYEEYAVVAEKLNEILATYHVVYQNLRTYHWYVGGEGFFTLHEKFEEYYDDIAAKIDEVAERVLAIDAHPLSKWSEYLEISHVSESERDISAREMVEDALSGLETVIEMMKDAIDEASNVNDEGTIDLLGGYIREHEKTCWTLRAWLRK